MRRFWWAFVLLRLTAGLLAQSSPPTPNQPDAAPSPPAPCIVAGRVVTAAEGTPVKSAHVTLWQQNKLSGPHADIYDVSTDGEGHFLVKDVAPGRYEFVVSHTGFVSQHYQANGDDEGAVLALTAGQKITDVLFRMRLAAVITGRVNDAEGEPMVGLQVAALRRPTERGTEPRPQTEARANNRRDGVQ